MLHSVFGCFPVTRKAILVSLICAFLFACTSSPAPEVISRSPSDLVLDYFRRQPVDTDFRATKAVQSPALLAELPQGTRDALASYPQQAGKLLRQYAMTGNMEMALQNAIESSPRDQDVLLYIALALYPNERQEQFERFMLNDAFDENTLMQAALLAQLDPSALFPATAAGTSDLTLKPLFHSVGISIANQTQDNRVEVEYRKLNTSTWLSAKSLSWDPTQSRLAGSIVRLSANTDYQLRLKIYRAQNLVDEITETFKTWAEEPPINPDLVYRLEDIYSGGMLDLELLNIQGAPDGWAKIIGSDSVHVIAGETDNQAINIGNNSYIMFENVVVRGGNRYGIRSKEAHHLWFRGCDVAQFGRAANHTVDGIAYASADDPNPINYDAGFYLEHSGVVVVEYCDVHSPVPNANHWRLGHPQGATAYLTLANHPNAQFSGQHVLRYNRFYGTQNHRFNDVIESRSNGRVWGGFAHHSAIHDNYLAYANDDVLEIDGGMQNVLIYNNDIEQGFAGISATPNMLGPVYIFNNYIHNLGDVRGQAWAAIKLGGLITKPAGITYLFDNLILTKGAGIGASKFQGDSTYWTHMQNNIVINSKSWNLYALSVYDLAKYSDSKFINNFLFNTRTGDTRVDANIDQGFHAPDLVNQTTASNIIGSEGTYAMPTPFELGIPNFSKFDDAGNLLIGVLPWMEEPLPISETDNVTQGQNDALIPEDVRTLDDDISH